jgi:PAS domain S-box-containing protein
MLTIVAIDENADNLLAVVASIRDLLPGTQIFTAQTGRAGIALARAYDPDILLLDIIMEERDGYVVCRELKSDPILQIIPVIFVTPRNSERTAKMRGLEALGDAFLSRPFDEAGFIAEIRAMARIKAANRRDHEEKGRLSEVSPERREEQESERWFRSLFMNINEGVAIHEIVTDEMGNPIDFVFLAVNPTYERICGLHAADILGRRGLDVIPMLEKKWIDLYGKVAHTGEAVCITDHSDYLDRYWEVKAFPLGPNLFGVALHDITEQKNTEDTRTGARRELRLILDTVPALVWKKDTEGRYQIANTRYCEVTGLAEEEILGRTDHEIFPQIIADQYLRDDQVVMRSETALRNREEMHRKESGEVGWSLTDKIPWYDAGGAVAGTIGFAIDITERKQAEEKLHETKERFDSLFNRSLDCVYIHDLEGTFIDANPAACELLGYSRKELPTISFSSIVCGDQLVKAEELTRRIIDIGTHEGLVEYRLQTKNGDCIDIETKGSLITRDGEPVAILGIARDITERKRAERALRESEEKYRLIAENTADNIWIFDMDFRLQYISPSVLKMKGFTVSEALAQAVPEMMTPSSYISLLQRFTEEMEREATGTADPNRTVTFETEEYCKDGRTILVENATRLLRDEEGRPVGILGISRDITERKRAEEALHTANKKLQILSGITRHDILNMIMGLGGFIWLTREEGLNQQQAIYLDEIEKIIKAIERQIEFTRTYEELGVQMPTWIALTDIIDEGDDTPIPIRYECTNYLVRADPMIRKVFANLMENTIRHAEGATGVQIHCMEQNSDLVICWEDNGPGIPDDQKEQIFEKGIGKNTGFGLFLSREILGITGIAIRETGIYGKGARFEITVPDGGWQRGEER